MITERACWNCGWKWNTAPGDTLPEYECFGESVVEEEQ